MMISNIILIFILLSSSTSLSFYHLFSKKLISSSSSLYLSSKNDPKAILLPDVIPLISDNNDNGGIRKVLDYNWRYGYCSHRVCFEGTEIIRRLRLKNGLLAFGMIDGRVCVIELESGKILNKYHEHSTEISAIDFQNDFLVTGGGDGKIVVYNIKNDIENTDIKISKASNSYNLFSRSISGLRIMISKSNPTNKLLICCSMDKSLKAIDLETGSIKFQLELNTMPLCLDTFDDYICIGGYDGKVIFISSRSGRQILTFQAHTSKVRSIHLQSKSILLTGGSDGSVKMWDLSGSESSKPVLSNINRPTGFLDYYFSEAIDAKGGVSVTNTGGYDNNDNNKKKSNITTAKKIDSNVRIFEHSTQSSPVVAIQGDENKIIVAYDDGMISCWDLETGRSMFDLKGRSNLISSLQFDETRLVADGTHSIVVIHDFNDTKNSDSDLHYELNSNEEGDDDEYDEGTTNDDGNEDNKPSATS